MKIRELFREHNLAERIYEFTESTATSQMAADAMGIEIGQICKTLSFKNGENGCILIQTSGDTKISNKKFKTQFSMKPKMLDFETVESLTGYKVGGVCAFCIDNENVEIFLDNSLKRYDFVYPACGTGTSMAKLSIDELEKLTKCSRWIDVSDIKE